MKEITAEILALVKKKMAEQGAFSRDAYKQFVEESINYYLERGRLTDDDNLEFIEDGLLDMWEEVSEGFVRESDNKK